MLLLDKKAVTVEGISCFPDHAVEGLWWYTPGPPALTVRRADNRKDFTLLKYKPAAVEGGAKGGGFAMFSVNLKLDPVVEGKVRAKLASMTKGKITLSPIPFDDGTVQCIALNVQGGGGTAAPSGNFRMVEEILGTTVPSIAGDNTAAFSLVLSQEGATLLEAAFKAGTTPIGVVYNLKYTALRPALSVTITADMKRIFNHFSAGLSAQYYIFRADLAAGLSKLQQEGALQISVTNFSTAQDKTEKEQWAINLFMEKLLNDWFRPTLALPNLDTAIPNNPVGTPAPSGSPGTAPGGQNPSANPAGAPVPTGGGSGGQTGTTPGSPPPPPGGSVHAQEHSSGLPAGSPVSSEAGANPGLGGGPAGPTADPGTSPVSPTGGPGANPGPGGGPAGPTADPGTSPVSPTGGPGANPGLGGGPAGPTADPGTSPVSPTGGPGANPGPGGGPGGPTANPGTSPPNQTGGGPIQNPTGGSQPAFSLNVKFIRTEELKTITFKYDSSEAVQRTFAPQGFFGLMLADLVKADHFVEIDLDDSFFRTMKVSVDAPYDFDKIGLKSIHVGLDYGNPADPSNHKHKDFVFDKTHQDPQIFETFLNASRDITYIYQPQYHFSPTSGWEGEKFSYELAPITTADRTLLLNPWDHLGFLEISVFPRRMDRGIIASTDVILEYHDKKSGWKKRTTIQVTPDSQPQSWKLRLSDPSARAYTYKLIHHFKDGSAREGETVLTQASAVPVDDPFESALDLLFFPALDPAKTKLAFIDVKYKDSRHSYERDERLRLAADSANEVPLRIVLFDSSLKKYSYRCTFVGHDGKIRAVAPIETEETLISVSE
ncbi:MAG: hypothetical protein MRJ68_05575 [Nitrospira sp.]|nr:hypothetical protein [Nitrospira sp.]